MQITTTARYDHDVHVEADETQYLTFRLGDEQFGVDILEVQEIRGWTPATVIPNAPVYMKGVINLRGAIVPVIDLRIRLGLQEAEYTQASVVIVMVVQRGASRQTVGFVVDSVSDVLNIADEQLRELPSMDELAHSSYLSGIAARGNQLVLILDANRLFDESELAGLESLKAGDRQGNPSLA